MTIESIAFRTSAGHDLRVTVTVQGTLLLTHTNGQRFELNDVVELIALRDAITFLMERNKVK